MLAMYAYYAKETRVDKLSANHSYNYIRAVVWYHSRGKLEEIKSILASEDLKNKDQIRLKIDNMLRHRSSAYIRDFNNLDAPVEKIGDIYEKIFDFDAFLEDVYVICFSDELPIDTRISLISDIMEKYQMETNDKILSIMKGEN